MADTPNEAADTKRAGRADATVAPRRTVHVNGRNYSPGMVVSLPRDEIARLRQLGYLVDPAAPETPVAGGSSVSSPL